MSRPFRDPTIALPHFMGSDIKYQIEGAVDNLPKGYDIVTFSAGENMPIIAGMANDDVDTFSIPEFGWDGETWIEIGFL